MIKKIEALENKFDTIDNKVKSLIDIASTKNELLTKIDFINAIGIDIEEYDLLTDYANIETLSTNEINRLIAMNDSLEQKFKYIDLINEKIILSCTDFKKINKNTISYILNKKNKDDTKQNVIINVKIDDEEEFSLEELTKEK